MEVNFVDFVGSFTKVNQCPTDRKPEYAFIGRSNVGKSSLINSLCGRTGIARVSKTPGKTQHLNYYLADDRWYIVDLPGYGYAKISQTKRKEWQKMIDRYLSQRESLCGAFILIDINVPPQKIDIEFINNLGVMRVPFAIVYTKADRLKPAALQRNKDAFEKELLNHWEELPTRFVSSSNTNLGRKEILQFIDEVNTKYYQFLNS